MLSLSVCPHHVRCMHNTQRGVFDLTACNKLSSQLEHTRIWIVVRSDVWLVQWILISLTHSMPTKSVSKSMYSLVFKTVSFVTRAQSILANMEFSSDVSCESTTTTRLMHLLLLLWLLNASVEDLRQIKVYSFHFHTTRLLGLRLFHD